MRRKFPKEEIEPQFDVFDRIIHETPMAILYGYKEKMFWLPKSVHRVEAEPNSTQPGELCIEGWATYHKTNDPKYIPTTTGSLSSIELLDDDFEDIE